ncbi:hypothetical protein A2247_02810 [candidate division WOR-1 bacterium RIFOXYA2_FULL_41_14]|nr:MAG: hypothetical protein A2247_02810 [candidate division WOR-1 bacterium RIFOXYA2_FULL_41_14]
MKIVLFAIFTIFLNQLIFAQKVESADKSDAYLIYKKLPLDENEKMMFEESFDLEKESEIWINSRQKLRIKVKEIIDSPKSNTAQLENLKEDINEKSYDIDEYYEIINETRKKIYLKYLKQKKRNKLKNEQENEINKLIEQAETFFYRTEEIRKRAYKLDDFNQTCQALNNAVDFENMGIKKLEKALKILLSL